MAFSGTWANQRRFTDPAERLHVADPDHGQDDPDPNGTRLSHMAPPGTDAQAPYLESGAVWTPRQTPGGPVDQTPDSHDSGGGHDVDMGAVTVDTWTPLVPRFSTERDLFARFESTPATPVSPVALVRGLNSNAENQPDGFRRGFDSWYVEDRKLYVPERTPDERWWTPNTVDFDPGSHAVPGPYGSPYPSHARIVTRMQTPMMRRDPVPVDQAMTTDGWLYQPDPAPWVVG